MSEQKREKMIGGPNAPKPSDTPAQAEEKAERARQRRKPPTFDEPVPTNETTEPCPLCAAPPGMPHGRGCAYAAEWVERERVWRLENAE